MRRAMLALALVAAAACAGGGDASYVVDGWRQEGLEPSTFAEAKGEPFGGGKCRAGTVATLDATVCEFPDESAARKAEPAGEKVIGEATGISMAAGKLLLVVADRKRVDPEGRKLNQVAQSFRKRAL
jgi:hypothetical protein